jgi:hypothetical protein
VPDDFIADPEQVDPGGHRRVASIVVVATSGIILILAALLSLTT